MTATKTPAPKARKPRPKPARKVRLEGTGNARLLVITETEQLRAGPRVTVTRYLLAELKADFGRGFRLSKAEKDGGEVYDVCLGGGPYNSDSCDCPGGSYAGHCKHTEAIRCLVAAGRV